jgi:hypothetical protein
MRALVTREIGRGSEPPIGQSPFTPKAKRALELALHECLALGHKHIGAEHLLLALVRAGDGFASEMLRTSGLELDDVRAAVLPKLGGIPATYEKRMRRAGRRTRRRRMPDMVVTAGLVVVPLAIGILVGWAIWG